MKLSEILDTCINETVWDKYTYEKDSHGSGVTKKYFTILGVAKYIESELGGKISYKSKSGSVYVKLKTGQSIRISDHAILSMNRNSYDNTVRKTDFEIYPNDRYGFEFNKTVKDIAELKRDAGL